MKRIRGAVAAAWLALCCTQLAAAEEAGRPAARSGPLHPTRVVMLGTGNPYPDPVRSGPAVAVLVGGQAFLVDAGAGVMRRASAAWRGGIAALHPARISHVFITHLHSDHTIGLPDVFLTPWTMGRKGPLDLWGPPGIAEMAEHVGAAYRADIAMRVGGLEKSDPGGAQMRVHEVEPGVVLRTEGLTITAFGVDHGSWEHAFGYRFDAVDRSIVVSGDTTKSESLIRAAAGCDVLIHEAYVESAWKRLPPGGRRYHGSFHTSAVDLGRIAAKVKPGLLVVTHALFFDGTPAQMLEEIRRHWSGAVVIADDLDVF